MVVPYGILPLFCQSAEQDGEDIVPVHMIHVLEGNAVLAEGIGIVLLQAHGRAEGGGKGVRRDDARHGGDIPDDAAPGHGALRLAGRHVVAEIVAQGGIAPEEMLQLVDAEDQVADDAAAGEEESTFGLFGRIASAKALLSLTTSSNLI